MVAIPETEERDWTLAYVNEKYRSNSNPTGLKPGPITIHGKLFEVTEKTIRLLVVGTSKPRILKKESLAPDDRKYVIATENEYAKKIGEYTQPDK